MKKIFTLFFVVVVIGAVFYYSAQTKKPILQSPREGVSSDLQELGDPELGFNFQLPNTFIVSQNGQFSRLYSKKTDNLGTGPSNFIYISVIPTGKDFEDGEIYNYSSSDLQRLNGLSVGESVQVGGVTDPGLSGYYKYIRIDDVMVGGYGAKAFKNEKPWEFPNGTVEYRYVIPFSQATYLIGGYTSSKDALPSGISRSEMDDILKNLKLSPATLTINFTSPVPEKEWKTFSDDKAAIAFDYPSGWDRRSGGQNFPEGDLFSIVAIGQTQRPQTELYDGVSFSVMNPISFTGDLSEWMKERYDQSEFDPEKKPDYSQVSFGGKTYQKVTVCGLGCFTYYHIVQNDKLYGFVVNAVGPHQTSYESAVSKILSSVIYK